MMLDHDAPSVALEKTPAPSASSPSPDKRRTAAATPEARLASLSPRERQVFALVVMGSTTPEIAAELKLSPKTVEAHRQGFRRKLDLHTLGEALAVAELVGMEVAPALPTGVSARKLLAKLAHRERQVFDLVVEGKSGPEIAKVLGISPKTVETHGSRVNVKLGVKRTAYGAVARQAARETEASLDAGSASATQEGAAS